MSLHATHKVVNGYKEQDGTIEEKLPNMGIFTAHTV